jgi:hypothetical protein
LFGYLSVIIRTAGGNGAVIILRARGPRLHVFRQQGLERLRGLPLRMLRRQRPDAVECEGELEIERLFGPRRAVIVEGRDALGRRTEVSIALRRTRSTKSVIACLAGPSLDRPAPTPRIGRGLRPAAPAAAGAGSVPRALQPPSNTQNGST